MDIPASVRPLFLAAGWQSGRRIRVDGRVPELHPAHSILQGLAVFTLVGQNLQGSNALVPTWSSVSAKQITKSFRLGELLRSRLVEVAEVHNAMAG